MDRRRPSLKGGVVLTLGAFFLTYMAVWMVIHPGARQHRWRHHS